MNRRNRGSGRKLLFEPKVQEQPIEEDKEVSKVKEAVQVTQKLKGLFAPVSSVSNKKIELEDNSGFFIAIPKDLSGASMVVFSDGSIGIRHEGVIYETETSYWGNSLVFEFEERARGVGKGSFLLTPYLEKTIDDVNKE